MQRWGEELQDVDYGNAWDLRSSEHPHTNWILGDHPGISANSLRFLRHHTHPNGPERVEDLALKWFVHDPADPPAWGEIKPLSTGRSLSLLAGDGAFELHFQREGQELRLLLERAGDFALWGPGVAHRWRVLKPSTVMTLRWTVL